MDNPEEEEKDEEGFGRMFCHYCFRILLVIGTILWHRGERLEHEMKIMSSSYIDDLGISVKENAVGIKRWQGRVLYGGFGEDAYEKIVTDELRELTDLELKSVGRGVEPFEAKSPWVAPKPTNLNSDSFPSDTVRRLIDRTSADKFLIARSKEDEDTIIGVKPPCPKCKGPVIKNQCTECGFSIT